MNHNQLTDRTFGLVFALVFSVIGGFVWFSAETLRIWPFATAAVFLILALSVPDILLPLNRIWGWITLRLGGGINYILLGIVFYIAVFPYGLVLRLIGWDAMGRKSASQGGSYFSPVTRPVDRTTLKDTF